ncbi:MAG: tetratricopeptide repeat protein [Flavobacteriaceae bacterium]
MKKHSKNATFQGIIFLFFIGVFITLSFACKREIDGSEDVSNKVETDSVMLLVEAGRNKKNSVQNRLLFLERALHLSNEAINDSIKLQYLGRIQWSFLRLNDSLAFRNTNEQTKTLAIRLKDSNKIALTHWDLGTFLDNQDVKDSAYFHYSTAHKIYNEIGDQSRAGRTLYSVGQVQYQVKDYSACEATIIKAIQLLKPLNENLQLYHCYNLLGVLAKDLKEYDRALEQYESANDYLNKLNKKGSLQIQAYNNLGVVYQEMGEHNQAVSYFEKVLEYDSLYYDRPRLYARALNNLANNRLALGDNAKVESQLKEALEIRSTEDDIAGTAGSYYSLAKFYLAQNDTSKADYYAQKSRTSAIASSNNERLLDALDLLTQVDSKNAGEYAQQYISLSNGLQQTERQIRDKFARIQFETEEVEAQNALLARQRQLWIGIAVGLLLLAIAIFVIISQRVKNQKLKFQQQQQEANNEIFSLMLSQKQKVEEGKQSEQKRISEELHDGVLGEMNGARMILVGLNQKSDEEAIAMRSKAIEKLQEVQEEIRTISHELSDAAYQKFHNFIISIQELLQAVGDSASLEHSFTYDEDIEWDDLSAEIKINLHRIIQESLTNCVKHAQAKHISLDFKTDGNTLLVLLKDDGKGFDTKKGKKGIGHKNISSRVEKIDGSWEVKSAQGEGTEVLVRIPIAYSSTPQHLSAESEGLLRKV